MTEAHKEESEILPISVSGLRHYYRRLSEVNTDCMDKIREEKDEKVAKLLQSVVIDDMHNVEAIQDLMFTGRLLDMSNDINDLCYTLICSATKEKYVPFLHAVTSVLPLGDAFKYIAEELSKISPAHDFKSAILTLDSHMRITEDAVYLFDVKDGKLTVKREGFETIVGIKDFTELLAYCCLLSGTQVFTTRVYTINAVGDFNDAYNYAVGGIVQEYNAKVRAYADELSAGKEDPFKELERLVRQTEARCKAIEVILDDHRFKNAKLINAVEYRLKRRNDDSVVVGCVAVLLIIGLVMSFLH